METANAVKTAFSLHVVADDPPTAPFMHENVSYDHFETLLQTL